MPPRSMRMRAVLDRAERLRDARRRIELGAMALPVVDAQRVALQPLLARDRERGGGIEAAGKQDDCARFGHHEQLLSAGRVAPQILVQLDLQRTGSRSSRIHCARSRGSQLPVARAEQHRAALVRAGASRTRSRAHSKSARLQITNLICSSGAQQRRDSRSRLRATSPLPGVLTSTTRTTRGSTLLDVDRAAGLERNAIAGVAQPRAAARSSPSAPAARRR